MNRKFRRSLPRAAAALVAAVAILPLNCRASLFGEEDIILGQILANAVEQLSQLKDVVSNASDQLGLLREINRGIGDAMEIVRTRFPNANAGGYKSWDNIQSARNELERKYGSVAESPQHAIQEDADRSAAEAIALNNSIYKYTDDLDTLGEQVKDFAHVASPAGAQKLTAESLGLLLHAVNQSLRTQATMLKLQAQTLALSNRSEKDETRHQLEVGQTFDRELKALNPTFTLPDLDGAASGADDGVGGVP